MSRIIDADKLKQRYREKIIKTLVDHNRGIDLSEHAKDLCDAFNKFVDEEPTVLDINNVRNALSAGVECVEEEAVKIEKIRAEIEQYNRQPSNYPVDKINIGTVLQIIDKYTKGESEVFCQKKTGRKTGKWIKIKNSDMRPDYICSKCKAKLYETVWANCRDFCPNCGAKMADSQESENKE